MQEAEITQETEIMREADFLQYVTNIIGVCDFYVKKMEIFFTVL